MKQSKEAPAELSLDALDEVVGGKGTAIINGTLGLGPVSVGVSVDLQNGNTYVTGGLSPSMSIGGSVSLGVVIPYNPNTPASDVITGPSVGGEAYFGGGGGVSANGSGVIVSGGFGLSIGGGVTDTASTAPDTHSPTVSMPVYDTMGNSTGFTTEMPNPNYDGNHDPSGDTTHAGDDANHQPDDPGHDAGDGLDGGHDGASLDGGHDGASLDGGHDGSDAGGHDGFDGGGHDGSDAGGHDGSDAGGHDGFDGGGHDGSDGGGYSGGFDGGDFGGDFA